MGWRRAAGRACAALLAAVVAGAPAGGAAQGIVDTKHNLSLSGPGPIKALSETRVCVFCHTPHNANPMTPLWNRELGGTNYALYSNPPTMVVSPGQPGGPSRLCLSCHDGMIALGAVRNPTAGIAMTSELSPGNPSLIGAGADLSADHPFSFPYADATADPTIRPTPAPGFVLYGASSVECPTCHDAHRDRWRSPDASGDMTGKFLVADSRFSGVCLGCHDIPGWVGSSHQQSGALVDASVLPVPPRQWPTWPTLAEWGCEACHVPHNSGSGALLLNRATEAETCAPCHGAVSGPPHSTGATAARDIVGQTLKISAHRMDVRRPGVRNPRNPLEQSDQGEVTCSDCHNSHAMDSRPGGESRDATLSGRLRGVPGVDRSGTPLAVASKEYEICLRCHGDRAAALPRVQRVVSTTNARLQFDTTNPSFHPVFGPGRGRAVPSLSSQLEPGLTASSTVRCTDCHRDDDRTSAGPHGSGYPPILRERYETADGTPEGPQAYALCYRCHERSSILGDVSFRRKASRVGAGGGGHSGHLAAGAPCSACHDAHGVVPQPGTGDHERLINFDVMIVSPAPGKTAPLFDARGSFAGSCTLVCHGREHRREAYP